MGSQISGIVERIAKVMAGENRKDIEFRLIITSEELGDCCKYVVHDPKLNPGVREHGTKEDEKMAYGQLFIQAFASAWLRGIDPEEAIEIALKNWEAYDWKRSKASGDKIKGYLVCQRKTYLEGEAFLDPDNKNLDKLNRQILVTKFARPEIAEYFRKASGVVTDEGGVTSHAATIAREYSLACIVGTGNATEKISHGQRIRLRSSKDLKYGFVDLL